MSGNALGCRKDRCSQLRINSLVTSLGRDSGFELSIFVFLLRPFYYKLPRCPFATCDVKRVNVLISGAPVQCFSECR